MPDDSVYLICWHCIPVKPKASLEAAREVDFGRSSASVLQASLRLDLSPKSPVMTLSFI